MEMTEKTMMNAMAGEGNRYPRSTFPAQEAAGRRCPLAG